MRFRYKNEEQFISYGTSWGLIETLEKFVYTPSEEYLAPYSRCDVATTSYGIEHHFPDLYEKLELYALESSTTLPYTALHKTLMDIAELELYTYLYDDLDWVEEPFYYFKQVMRDIFSAMHLEMPIEFKRATSIAQVYHARDKYRKEYLSGLQTIVKSTFAILWYRKSILYQFNLLMSEKITPLNAKENPELVSDGVLKRRPPPKWIKDLVYSREMGACHYCAHPVAPISRHNNVYDIDHMIPLALGGTNDPTNFVLSCPKCNNNKRANLYPKPDNFHWPNFR